MAYDDAVKKLVAIGLPLVMMAVVASGCNDRLCYDVGIDPNGRYRASLVETYDMQGHFTYDHSLAVNAGLATGSCAGFDGIAAPTVLELQGKGTVDNSNRNCKLITADLVAAPSEIVPGSDSAQSDAREAQLQVADISLMYVAEAATIGGCGGALGIGIRPGAAGQLFATPMTGTLPPALLYRLFVPSIGSCQPCEDSFVIQLTKE